ncbi:MAG: hypothetical protein KGL54_06330 [Sphingomonadales bacterium]|nr:hypothetical protein [Sphingomonadales bacterium]
MSFAARTAAPRPPRTPDEAAFGHYLRTGERLTTAEWLARQEVKFNPWHDRLGRFTYGPGGVDGGSAGRGASAAERLRGAGGSRTRATGQGRLPTAPATPRSKPPTPSRPEGPAGNGFRSDLVRGAVAAQTSTADTYFELNKRQAGLDQLRAKAGPNPAPAVAADLADFQARLDANRALLDKRYRFADAQVLELARSGLAPLDIAAGAAKIAAGRATVGDYLALGAAVPMGGMVRKIGKVAEAIGAADRVVEPLGGAYRTVRKLQPKGNEAHHLIAQRFKALPTLEAPTISMLKADHKETVSWGRRGNKDRYTALVKGRIEKQGIIAALEMEGRFIRRKLGHKYDAAIEQAIAYGRSIGYKAWLIRFFR